MSETPVPQIVAHRGYMQHFPENTWAALEAALAAGACWLEFDVQMCADGRFLLLHDADFQRTADRAQSVFDRSADELQGISVHEPKRFGERFAVLSAPLLETVLQRLADYPDCRAMVEIKHESLLHWGVPAVMERLLSTLAPHQARCVLISYREDALHYAAQHSDIRIGWVLRSYDDAHRQRAETLKPQFLICNQDKIAPTQSLWSGAWQWMLYDILEAERALTWAKRGVGLIETADVGTLLKHPALASAACDHGL